MDEWHISASLPHFGYHEKTRKVTETMYDINSKVPISWKHTLGVWRSMKCGKSKCRQQQKGKERKYIKKNETSVEQHRVQDDLQDGLWLTFMPSSSFTMKSNPVRSAPFWCYHLFLKIIKSRNHNIWYASFASNGAVLSFLFRCI